MDVCISNAGMIHDEPVTESTPAVWWHTLAVNLQGTYATVRACLPGMVQRRGGTVICVISAPLA